MYGMGYIVCVIWVCKELGVWNGVYGVCHMGVQGTGCMEWGSVCHMGV